MQPKLGDSQRTQLLHPYSTSVEIQTIDGPSSGIAYFDEEPHFPSFALFLDVAQALVLKRDESKDVYTRIGVASFSLTETQSQKRGTSGDRDDFGPIKRDESRVTVTII
jgi:hypothetical protein